MRLRLDNRWSEKLKGWPESGMGYQLVDVTMSDGRTLAKAIVLNAEWIEVPNEFVGAELVEMRPHREF